MGETSTRAGIEATLQERRFSIVSFLPRSLVVLIVCIYVFFLLRWAFGFQRLSLAVPVLWLMAVGTGTAKTLWAARQAEWFRAKYLVDTKRIVAVMPSGLQHEARWADLVHVYGMVRPPASWPGLILAMLANLIWPKTGLTLRFRSGVEVVVPFSPRPRSTYVPVAQRIALAGPSDNPLLRLLEQWEEWRLRFFGPISIRKLACYFHVAGQVGPAALLLVCVILREVDPTFREQFRGLVVLSLVMSPCFLVATSILHMALVSRERRSRRE